MQLRVKVIEIIIFCFGYLVTRENLLLNTKYETPNTHRYILNCNNKKIYVTDGRQSVKA